MKATLFISIIALVFGIGCSRAGTAEFKVLGECSMCKTRIEQAATMDGVTMAHWDMGTQILTVEYSPSEISLEDLHIRIAATGHDTEEQRADDAVYDKLPACCKYERTIHHQN